MVISVDFAGREDSHRLYPEYPIHPINATQTSVPAVRTAIAFAFSLFITVYFFLTHSKISLKTFSNIIQHFEGIVQR